MKTWLGLAYTSPDGFGPGGNDRRGGDCSGGANDHQDGHPRGNHGKRYANDGRRGDSSASSGSDGRGSFTAAWKGHRRRSDSSGKSSEKSELRARKFRQVIPSLREFSAYLVVPVSLRDIHTKHNRDSLVRTVFESSYPPLARSAAPPRPLTRKPVTSPVPGLVVCRADANEIKYHIRNDRPLSCAPLSTNATLPSKQKSLSQLPLRRCGPRSLCEG